MKRLLPLLMGLAMLVSCTGINVPPTDVWIMPACLVICTAQLAREQVLGVGAATGGGITSTSSLGSAAP